MSYDKKKVVLAQDNGYKVKVPRSSVPKHYKLKTGRRVHAVLDSKKFLKMIKAQEEAKKKGKKPLGVDTKRGLKKKPL